MNEDCLKFRVWDEEKQKYHSGAFGLSPSGELLVEWVMGFIKYPYPYVIEKCTGLKDKNGRLIYEGDVLEYTFGIGKNSSPVQWFVAWVERYTSFRMVDVAGFNYLKSKNPGWSFEQYLEFNVYGFDTHSIVCRGYEVVGNIHETKWGIESEVKQ